MNTPEREGIEAMRREVKWALEFFEGPHKSEVEAEFEIFRRLHFRGGKWPHHIDGVAYAVLSAKNVANRHNITLPDFTASKGGAS